MNYQAIIGKRSAIQNFFIRPIWIIKEYSRQDVWPDLIAGLTVAVVLIPQAMAYALIAELPPQMGLYAAIFGAIVGALWGSSFHLQTGPTNAQSLIVLSALLLVAAPGTAEYLAAAALLTLLVGIIRAGMGLARLGMLINFVSDSVIVGFTSGAGVLIFFNQLRHILRLDVPSAPELGDTISNLLIRSVESHLPSFILGTGTILVILVLKWVNNRLPGALIAIVGASLVVVMLGLESQGIKVIGDIPKGLPPIVRIPILDLKLISNLSAGALAISAIGLVEAMSIARSTSIQTGQRLDSNQEFFGQGLANIVCSLFSGYTCSGSFTRTAINFQSGGRTPMANVFCGVIVLVVVVMFGFLTAYIPLPALAGVVILVSLSLIDVREMRSIWFGPRGDRIIMVVTFLSTLLLPLIFAVFIGILVSLAYYLLQTSTPRVRAVTPDENFEYLVQNNESPVCPQLGIIEILGDLYFGAAHHVEETILNNLKQNPNQRYLLLRMYGVEYIDVSGIHALQGVVRIYRERNGDVFISRYHVPVLDILRETRFYEYLGERNFLGRDQDAIGYLFYKVLDPAICIYECPHRVFQECQNLPKQLDLANGNLQLNFLEAEVSTIQASDLWEEMHNKKPPLVIDIREPREFQRGHIPGACSIPLHNFLNSYSQRFNSTDEVILVCRSGRRSMRAACVLRERGYENIIIVEGGMLSWEAINLLEAIDE